MTYYYAVISNNVVTGIIETHEEIIEPTYIPIASFDAVELGSVWDGSVFSPPVPSYRTILTGTEWVEAFTDPEWKWLKARRVDDTPAGDRLDQMMDAIRWTDSINVVSTNMDEFYTWLLGQGIPGGQTRIDELRQGILE